MSSSNRFRHADGILDLRDRETYRQGHLCGATWMEAEYLDESLNQLPAAPAELFLIGDKERIEEASIFLDMKGYSVSGSIVLQTDQDITFWREQLGQDWCQGKDSKTLWSPSDLVTYFAESLLPEIKQHEKFPQILDLGCGGGRDAIFLAKQRCRVTAIDQEARVIKRAKRLAQVSGAQVNFKCCNLKQGDCLSQAQFDLITMVRYLNRDLFAKIDKMLNPGGFVLIQTFSEGAEAFGSPKNPNLLLKEGELAEVFAGYRIIVDKIENIQDGRPVCSFIAQKPK
ncbi:MULTISPECIES: class I SAM-dependent methyltransferase [Thiomicrorhabdus]|uniref:Class I SAM-dependent methyltransferase n=1 Tax=Thiomicrorhabdus heinhorstiae TaxID=2748010 RepID=A0ABS0BY13_9GAMM|nr:MULTISPECIES: class I SAM-dependent methyltransferase [Thiomicrorhabdus]MBF6056957.1 class I SAM-dependent methyltransferase [Thiomicrorhabdus heinhorstiae]